MYIYIYINIYIYASMSSVPLKFLPTHITGRKCSIPASLLQHGVILGFTFLIFFSAAIFYWAVATHVSLRVWLTGCVRTYVREQSYKMHCIYGVMLFLSCLCLFLHTHMHACIRPYTHTQNTHACTDVHTCTCACVHTVHRGYSWCCQ